MAALWQRCMTTCALVMTASQPREWDTLSKEATALLGEVWRGMPFYDKVVWDADLFEAAVRQDGLQGERLSRWDIPEHNFQIWAMSRPVRGRNIKTGEVEYLYGMVSVFTPGNLTGLFIFGDTDDIIDAGANIRRDATLTLQFSTTKLNEPMGGMSAKHYMACRFMFEPLLCESRREAIPRQFAKRHFDKNAVPDIKYVTLRSRHYRKRDATETDEHRDVDWSCRWLVRMHPRKIRNDDGTIRLTMVRPHVKGPEDKPLRIPKETIFKVTV